jgi:hypothetical protein
MSEGSVLKEETEGRLVDISRGEKRDFLRNGMPLFLPVNKHWIKKYE